MCAMRWTSTLTFPGATLTIPCVCGLGGWRGLLPPPALFFSLSLPCSSLGCHARSTLPPHPPTPFSFVQHFLTGDGGFLQALMNGWGGLRITEGGLRMLRPYLPESVGQLRLRRFAWRGGHLTITVGTALQTVALLDAPIGSLCLTDANGASSQTLTPNGPPAQLDINSFAYPALLAPCA